MPLGSTRRSNMVDRLRVFRRLLTHVEVAQVKRFGFSLLSLVFRTRVLVLETTGRRSGKRRQTTVAYLQVDGGQLLIVGGAGGQSRLPDWVVNLRANSNVAIVLDRQRYAMLAIELHGDERRTAWKKAVEAWPRIETYERRAGREVPVIRLRRQ